MRGYCSRLLWMSDYIVSDLLKMTNHIVSSQLIFLLLKNIKNLSPTTKLFIEDKIFYYMKHFFSLLLMWALLALSCTMFYVAVTVVFPSTLINILSFLTAVFLLVQGCGLIDKEHGFGKHNNSKDKE